MSRDYKPKAVIFDIDCTLSDADWRFHLIEKAPKNWTEYFAQSINDKPLTETRNLSDWYTVFGHTTLFVTGRTEKNRDITVDWLKRILCLDHWQLFMRQNNDFRKGVDVKRDIYKNEIEQVYDVKAAFDDREDICQMWKSLGIPTFRVM